MSQKKKIRVYNFFIFFSNVHFLFLSIIFDISKLLWQWKKQFYSEDQTEQKYAIYNSIRDCIISVVGLCFALQ